MRAINSQGRLAVCLLSLFLMAACTGDDPFYPSSVTIHSYKVAVIMERDERERWERTAQWAIENIAEAQIGLKDRVELQLVFKSQDDSDFGQYMQQLAGDPGVAAIVGPTTSASAAQMALELGKEGASVKPMITLSAPGWNTSASMPMCRTSGIWSKATLPSWR